MVDTQRPAEPAESAAAVEPAETFLPETFLPETERDVPPVLPRLGPGGWLRWMWRQLTSMRTALLLLLLLAVAAVPGSIFPQRRIDTTRVDTYLSEHTATGPWLDRLGFFDVYTSPWFSAVYLLLFISLIGCVVPRARRHATAMRAAPPRTPRRLARMPEHAVRTADATPDTLRDAAQAVLRRRRYRVAVYDDGTSLSAEKGYLAETWNLLFHVSLLALLVSVGAGLFTGYGGQVLVVEGGTFSNSQPMYNTFTSGTRVTSSDLPPFAFTLDSLAVKFEQQSSSQLGAPREFAATVTVRDTPGAPARRQVIEVNHPLEVGGAKVYLAGNGYAPIVSVKDGEGAVVFRGPVPAIVTDGNYTSTVVIKAPDARPRQLGFAGTFVPTGLLTGDQGWISIFPDAHNPRLVLTAFAAAPGEDGLGANTGIAQSVYTLDVSKLTQLKGTNGQQSRILLAPGETSVLPENAGSITFEGLRRYASFDIHADPTKGWALGSALLALAGVTASLFIRRRRVWVRFAPEFASEFAPDFAPDFASDFASEPSGPLSAPGRPARTVVEVAGLARGEDAGLRAELAAILTAVAGPPAQDHTPGQADQKE